MVAAVGPAILDYVTRDLVERNLQLHQRFAWNTEFGTDPLQSIAQGGELRHVISDDDFDAVSGGLWHGPRYCHLLAKACQLPRPPRAIATRKATMLSWTALPLVHPGMRGEGDNQTALSRSVFAKSSPT